MKTNLQSKYLNVKSTLSPKHVTDWLIEHFPNASIVYITHNLDSPVVHTHFVVSFGTVTRWDSFRAFLMKHDPHSYSESARSYIRSVRYLIHADNPEKYQYSVSSIHFVGCDPDSVLPLLGSKSSDFVQIFNTLGTLSHLPTGQQFVSLMQRGYRPSEVSSVIRCLLDLQRHKVASVASSSDAACNPLDADGAEDDAIDSYSPSLFDLPFDL